MRREAKSSQTVVMDIAMIYLTDLLTFGGFIMVQ
jgi:hypothetical protein